LVGDEKNIIEDVSFANNKLIVQFMNEASDVLRIFDIQESDYKMAIELHEVKLPEKGTITSFAGDIDENMFLFKLETYTNPGDFYRLDLNHYELELFFKDKEYKTVTGYDSRNFEVDHITYKSKDGTEVPMTLVRK
jgi:prolyl oligopeptidase PreP (S9A serine peptidase family)